MNILITGAKGFVGKNLAENLKNVRDGKNRTREKLKVDEVFEYDTDNTVDELNRWAAEADFVFHMAGVNRTEDPADFMKGNAGFTGVLLESLKKNENTCPVMFASSVQASLSGRFENSEYGMSKRKAEELLFRHETETGAPVHVYRFPNVAGKWAKPYYNSAVATFCHQAANQLPITVNDPETELEVLFIDDLVDEMLDLLEGRPHRCFYPESGEVREIRKCDGMTAFEDENGNYRYVPETYRVKLGYIEKCLEEFETKRTSLAVPELKKDSFERKLYSMYLSYLPAKRTIMKTLSNSDERGVFTELFKSENAGQISVNVIAPGMTKGGHWHNRKCEIFAVVSGRGLVTQRKVGTDPETGRSFRPVQTEVSGKDIREVTILPGYTHEIRNLSKSENLVVVMWADEVFDKNNPDTYSLSVTEDEG